jgi:DNA ligase-1
MSGVKRGREEKDIEIVSTKRVKTTETKEEEKEVAKGQVLMVGESRLVGTQTIENTDEGYTCTCKGF